MQRVILSIGEFTEVVPSGTTQDQFVSIEGGTCRIYTGSAEPTDPLTGHAVSGGYQVIVPSGFQVWARLEDGAEGAAVVSDFGQ